MQLTLHATRRTHHGASRLVIDCEPGPAKPGVLRPGFVGTRGQWSYDYGMQDYEYTTPPTKVYEIVCLFVHLPGVLDAERGDGIRHPRRSKTQYLIVLALRTPATW